MIADIVDDDGIFDMAHAWDEQQTIEQRKETEKKNNAKNDRQKKKQNKRE